MDKAKKTKHSFTNFVNDPLVASSFVVIGLIALLLSILEFTKIMIYYPY